MPRIFNVTEEPVAFTYSGTTYTIMPLSTHYKRVFNKVQYGVNRRGEPVYQQIPKWVKDEDAERNKKRLPPNHLDITPAMLEYLSNPDYSHIRSALRLEHELDAELKQISDQRVEQFREKVEKYKTVPERK